MTGWMDEGHMAQSVHAHKPLRVVLAHTYRILGGDGQLKQNHLDCRRSVDLHRSFGFAGARSDDQQILAPNPRVQ